MKKILIGAVGALIAAAIGIALVFGGFFLRDPGVTLGRAALKTVGEVKAADTRLYDLYRRLTAGAWRQETSLSVSKPGGSLTALIDPRALSFLETVTLKHTARYDTAARRRADRLAAQIAVTTLAELEAESAADLTALRVPQLFDYFISFDPRRIAEEWDNSLLGGYLGEISGGIDADAFYDAYQAILLPAPAAPPDFKTHLPLLLEGAVFESLGDGLYSVAITQDALNAYRQAAAPDTVGAAGDYSFTQGLTAEVWLADGKITRVTGETGINNTPVQADIQLLGEAASLDSVKVQGTAGGTEFTAEHTTDAGDPDALYSRLIFEADGFALDWDINWDKTRTTGDNLRLTAAVEAPGAGAARVAFTGSLLTDEGEGYIDVPISAAEVTVDTEYGSLEATLSGRYTLREDTEALTFAADRRPLQTIDTFDLLGMAERLAAHAQLGAYMDGLTY